MLLTNKNILYFTFGQYQFTEGGTGEPNIHEIWAGGCHRLPSFTAMVGKGDCGNSNEEFQHSVQRMGRR